MNFFFRDIWRMDWGLGNPNYTAALIVSLMLFAWPLAYRGTRNFLIACLVFTGLGACLILTFSRGGLLALCVGSLVLLVLSNRPTPFRAGVMAGIAALLIGLSFSTSATDRYASAWQGDRSVTNRLELWREVPKMIHDSPGGWGLGHSQDAYMQWYQPLDRKERFLTLVSMHLTLLAEFPWVLRIGYVALWIFGAMLTFPTRQLRSLAIPFAVWISFFVAGIFTHFSSSWLVYIPPILALLAAVLIRIRHREWPSGRAFFLGAGAVIAVCLLLYSLGGGNGPSIRGDSDQVVVGSGAPKIWVLVNDTVLGVSYGKTFRRFSESRQDLPSLGFVREVQSLPRDSIVVLPGSSVSIEALAAKAPRAVLFLNPTLFPQQIPDGLRANSSAVFGELAQTPSMRAWMEMQKATLIPGSGDFLPGWPTEIFRHFSPPH